MSSMLYIKQNQHYIVRNQTEVCYLLAVMQDQYPHVRWGNGKEKPFGVDLHKLTYPIAIHMDDKQHLRGFVYRPKKKYKLTIIDDWYENRHPPTDLNNENRWKFPYEVFVESTYEMVQCLIGAMYEGYEYGGRLPKGKEAEDLLEIYNLDGFAKGNKQGIEALVFNHTEKTVTWTSKAADLPEPEQSLEEELDEFVRDTIGGGRIPMDDSFIAYNEYAEMIANVDMSIYYPNDPNVYPVSKGDVIDETKPIHEAMVILKEEGEDEPMAEEEKAFEIDKNDNLIALRDIYMHHPHRNEVVEIPKGHMVDLESGWFDEDEYEVEPTEYIRLLKLDDVVDVSEKVSTHPDDREIEDVVVESIFDKAERTKAEQEPSVDETMKEIIDEAKAEDDEDEKLEDDEDEKLEDDKKETPKKKKGRTDHIVTERTETLRTASIDKANAITEQGEKSTMAKNTKSLSEISKTIAKELENIEKAIESDSKLDKAKATVSMDEERITLANGDVLIEINNEQANDFMLKVGDTELTGQELKEIVDSMSKYL